MAAPAAWLHVVPPSFVLIPARTRLLAAHPFGPTNCRSAICPCSVCCRKLQLAPPSTLRRRKPPPPVISTVSADCTHTAFTSGCASACRRSEEHTSELQSPTN